MAIHFARCAEDDEYAKVSSFMIDRRRDLHPSLCAVDMVTMLYGYMTDGQLHYGIDDEGRIVYACAYYLGSPEENFTNLDTVIFDVMISDKNRRGTRLFLYGLRYFLEHVTASHPEAQFVRFCALSENTYLCNLYAKFARYEGTREGSVGQESVFFMEIPQIRYTLPRFFPLQ